jgi:chemotaxis protein CheX
MKSANELLAAEGSHQNWIPLMVTAAREVFELMLSCQLSESPAVNESCLDVTAMVGLAGRLSGLLSVRCNGKAASLMASKMLGLPLDKVSSEIADAMGEVCNMVAGNFKNKISGLAEGCMLSPPTVITGSDYTVRSISDPPAVEIWMLFEQQPLVISLHIHS